MARLKLLKANHQSTIYRLEDSLLTHYPQRIEENRGYIRGFETDLETLKAHPLVEGKFSMEVKGDVLTDKDNAGAAILEACKELKKDESMPIGSYRGFAMELSMANFGRDINLTLRGAMSHIATLGLDARGNLTRIDNALEAMPNRLTAVEALLENLINQQEAAKVEVKKPFVQADELKEKTARLAALDALLNADTHGGKTEDIMEKQERPSVLEGLKQPPQRGQTKDKAPQQEER
ncbi:helicase [Bengtsoniella intestinalis]|uniref:hypothetical protein n=1 Tax=Bengtsoniella intestinalis TaxID=3073143 RepID=UPI00391FC70F